MEKEFIKEGKYDSRIKLNNFSMDDLKKFKKIIKNLKLKRNKKAERESNKSRYRGLKKISKSRIDYFKKKFSVKINLLTNPLVSEIWESKDRKTSINFTYNRRPKCIAISLIDKKLKGNDLLKLLK